MAQSMKEHLRTIDLPRIIEQLQMVHKISIVPCCANTCDTIEEAIFAFNVLRAANMLITLGWKQIGLCFDITEKRARQEFQKIVDRTSIPKDLEDHKRYAQELID